MVVASKVVDVASLPQGTTVYNGQKAVTLAGSAEVLAAAQEIKGVVVKALSTNTGVVYVGDSSVSSANGYELSAGEAITLDLDGLEDVWLDVANSGEGVSFIATN